MQPRRRALTKAISWRVVATGITAVAVWVISGELILTAEVAAVDIVLKIFGYYLHERAWDRVT